MKKFFVIMLALAALVAFTAPAFAADEPGPSFVVGGRMLTDFGYNKLPKEQVANGKEDVTSAFINVAGHSYLNAKFTSADKTTGGLVELGVGSRMGTGATLTLRYAYGWWKVGNCKLVAGHNDSWIGSLIFAPKQYLGVQQSGKLLLSNWGYTYSGRHPIVRFEWESGMFGFSLAAAQPGAEFTPTAATGTDYYANLPRFDLAAYLKAGGFIMQPGFGWSQLKIEGTASGADDTFTQWIAMLPVKFSAGPFTAKAEIHYAQNSEIEWNGVNAGLKALQKNVPVISGAKVDDTKMVGGFVALEYKILPVWEITAGFGIEKLNNDAWKKHKNDEYTRKAFFVALPYQVTNNFSLHPELGYYDYGDNIANDKDFGNEWLLGMQFRFVF